jgi:hypothetical protein
MTTTLLSLLGGGGAGGAGVTDTKIIFQSKTITFRRTGKVRITQAGGAGSGGVAVGQVAGAVGGAGPGCLQDVIDVVAGSTAVITMGAGGLGVTQTGPGAKNGNAGGTTTTVLATKTLTCTGGAGGGAAQGATAAAVTVAGALGGVATGGNMNLPGGGSGSVAGCGATGGGALNLLGLALADIQSGSITQSNLNYRATGGSSPGGKSGSWTAVGQGVTGGGGMGGPGLDNAVTPGPDLFGVVAVAASPIAAVKPPYITVAASPIYLDGGGSPATTVNPAFSPLSGAGGGSGAVTAGTNNAVSGAAGVMAGSGGAIYPGISNISATSGAGGLMGGASGGAVCINVTVAAIATSGKAADGWVIIEELGGA